MNHLYCQNCREWTEPDPSADEMTNASCRWCGDAYECGECGYSVDTAGRCFRASCSSENRP